MSRLAAFAAVAALFLVGVLIGGFGTYLYVSPRQPPHPGPPGPSGGFRGGDPYLRMLEHELDLTQDQLRRVETILVQSRAEGEALRRELLPRLRSMLAGSREQIREILTPEQQERFAELEQRHRERVERMFLDRRGGHGRPPRGRPRHDPP